MTQKCSSNTRSRTYFFTINNVNEETELAFSTQECVYQIYQIEEGESGTIHLQGVVYYANARAFNSIKKEYPSAHIEVCKDIHKSIQYCSKEDTRIRGPYEYGTRPEQGKRGDLTRIKNQIMTGELTVYDIRQANPEIYHQYGRTLEAIETDFMNSRLRTEMTIGVWIWGKTGVGKSEMAADIAKDYSSIYYHQVKDKGWWCSYKQQECVVINDFRGAIEYDDLLNLTDWTPYHVSRRGKEPVSFISKIIIITSSLSPEEVYWRRMASDSIEQIQRRFLILEKHS